MEIKFKAEDKFAIPPRLQKLVDRSRQLANTGKRTLYTADETQLVYHWTDKCNGVAPQSGDWGFPPEQNLSLGDHACRVDLGIDFPLLRQVPSHVNGYTLGADSWGTDYAFLLDNSPVEIHPNEKIVGEFHWEMNEVRQYDFGEEVHRLGHVAKEAGAGGTSHGHTCPDYGIGLTQGWGGILQRIDKSIEQYERLMNPRKLDFLYGARKCCRSIIDYIARHADRADELAAAETDPQQKALYEGISESCRSISQNPPKTFYEGVQWIQFAVMTDRIVGHGNGYGPIDRYLNQLYQQDLAAGRITREEARVLLCEMFLKLRGQFFCLGGRNEDGSDATNDMSWIVMEAYDMIDDYNNLGVMWHEDMDPAFYEYVCDVLARHGAGVPSLVNYDLLVDSELRNGIPLKDARTVAYSGCQWYCIPGKEYCDQDVNALVMLNPLDRAMKAGAAEGFETFDQLYSRVFDEFRITCEAMRIFKDKQYDMLPQVWPEIVTSLNCHGPIERGLDMTDARGVDYQFTSTNILGIPNVADSLYAIRELVYEKKLYTLDEVIKAVESNWKDREAMRLQFLNVEKFGNDLEGPDSFYVQFLDDIGDVVDGVRNNRGQEYRVSLFQFQGHTCADVLPATPDGRFAEEPLAHGCNPTAGRNTRGLLCTANSMAKPHNFRFQGGALQVELQPRFFDGRENIGDYVKNLSLGFFRKGGIQINLNILDLKALEHAMENPEDPAIQNIIVKVTGYTSRFVRLDKLFQKEFLGRNNYESLC